MVRIAILGALVLAGCSKADPRPTDTAPPAATRGDGTKSAPPVQIQVAGAPGGAEAAAEGASANDTSFKVTTQQAQPTPPGGDAIARVVVNPGTGYKMNKDFPTKLTLEPPAGVTLSKTVFEPADAEKFDDHELAFAVKMTAQGAGEFTIPGTFKFAVCTETTCDPKKQKVALVLKTN
ncbi:MAG: hypothetical protein F9K40_18650 [Kofleriaceae bacterium]|nr:MAG: hypothetical protein F9K40_18650 [Kofleriaceae bacterium]MBZ0232050.1 hypothetical protein [Kofleriaceae bacterium]